MHSRDRERTRRRLLDAALVEFAAYGIAGARMERIARIARCSAGLAYNYYGGKDELFDAVQSEVMGAAVVEFDARDLPGYAARLYDLHHRHPEFARLATWQRLERRGSGSRVAEVEAIRSAQEAGVVSSRFSAEHVLQLVQAVASMWSNGTCSNHLERRRCVEEAVRRLVEP
ncbi:TetR family transcriptional regulator [Lentzea sp. BCCO 10_0798]|uniref:TetR family transcriptional regulator n=1 Tax=Lentzea kristufekii TaxID=3095430 RepID=A0ABU4TYV3_9PSEU|nr:TetR family transcriptional regulator [Lentzea sp. BCCO 10_0798]MDX8053499.1 TetR family transcriptional regulator [Lentzea sp. BCCO 10_0798]